jgi:hypothetical protein
MRPRCAERLRIAEVASRLASSLRNVAASMKKAVFDVRATIRPACRT